MKLSICNFSEDSSHPFSLLLQCCSVKTYICMVEEINKKNCNKKTFDNACKNQIIRKVR